IGTNFNFTITAPGFPNQTVTVPAGSSTDPGQCVIDGTYPVGTRVTVTEAIPPGFRVSNITTLGGANPITNPAAGTVSIDIGPGTTEVIFTNEAARTTLTVCKVAGEGVTQGAPFSFAVSSGLTPATFSLAAGTTANSSCRVFSEIPLNTEVTITETVPPGGTVSIAVSGGVIVTGPADGSVRVRLTGPTTVTFTNRRLLACTFSQGFFKNHAEALPATLTIGQTTLTRAQLVAVLQTPVRGNCAISLAHQLIAALANIQRGAAPADVQADINAAIAALANCSITFAGGRSNDAVFSCQLSQSACSLADRLGAFNEGNRGVPHCNE
ncbi:MAG: DUF5979 domain-containing protein, partial [Blastocatellia bacterium]